MGRNALTKMKIILIIFLIISCTPSTYASLKPNDFITPNDLTKDTNPENHAKIMASNLTAQLLAISYKFEALINLLNTYAESGIIYDKDGNVISYLESHVAALHIIRAIDKTGIVLEACFVHSLQMKYSEGYNKYIVYSTNIALFEKYYLPILQSSAATMGHNLKFIENEDIKNKTANVLDEVVKLFNEYLDYMNFLVK